MTNKNECIGCNSYINCLPWLQNFKNSCPCKKCLIKGMCNNPCEEYDYYVDIAIFKELENGYEKCQE